jgi:AcrR family transcriptional regulator
MVRGEAGMTVLRSKFDVNVDEFYNVDITMQAMPRTGRRRGDSGTREAIGAAARRQFAERGYAATTIRAVADEAGVDPALVLHYFGSKDELFAASVEWPFDPAEELTRILARGPEHAAEPLVRLFVTTWDREEGRNTIVALLRAAMTHEGAERLFREFVTVRVFGPLAEALGGGEEAALRVNLAGSQLIGLGVARYVLRVEPLASLPSPGVVALVAPAVQRHLTGPLPSSAAFGRQ